MKAEIHLLENDKQDIENEIKMKEVKAREKVLPEIERVKNEISYMNTEIANTQLKIEKEEAQNADMDAKLLVMEHDKEEYKDKIEALQAEYMKDRDEPVRIGKGNENLRKAVEHLRADLEKLQSETKTVEEDIEKEKKAGENIVK